VVSQSSAAAIESAINSLRAEQTNIAQAIQVLEGLVGSGPATHPHRAQPVASKKKRVWSSAARAAARARGKAIWAARQAKIKTKKVVRSAAQRKATSERMKAYWVAKRKQAA